MDGLVPALMEGAFQNNEESFHSKSYIWRPKEYQKQQQQHFITSLSSTVGSIQQRPVEYCG